MILVGLILLVAAIVVGVAGVLTNAGAEHALTDDFTVFGYHVTGSTGALFLYGIVVGAVGVLGLSLLLVAARRTSRRGRAARTELKQSRRNEAALTQQRDDLANTETPPSTGRHAAATDATVGDRSWKHPFGGSQGPPSAPRPAH
ncbi:hypothetical protein ABI214_09240 [Prescottella soli]|uniref:Lipopolysaccharide assembly protein A domain-containing protein n=1 Tax=Prescottella soli TaxID=1543852 RepID=A0ABW9FNX9_9NOCA